VSTLLLGAFTVTTKLESQEVGCRLNFGTNGSITSEIQVARTTGTTVTVTNLFEALPVRRGEFLRSIKKQYQKMIKVLQSYAIIAVGVRILVTNAGKVFYINTFISCGILRLPCIFILRLICFFLSPCIPLIIFVMYF
jgi:DNA mismatch repair ATPase MutL